MYANLMEGKMMFEGGNGFHVYGLVAWLKENGDKKVADVIGIMKVEQVTAIGIPYTVPETPAPVPPVVVNSPNAVQPADDFAERDAIKAALTKLGVPFNNKGRTEVLKKLLEDVKAKQVTMPFVQESPKVEEPAQTQQPAGPITLDQMREAVKKFAAIKGAVVAKDLLAKYGAQNVSGLLQKDYYEVLETIENELK